MKVFFQKIFGTIISGIVGFYFIGFIIYTPYYNWNYAKSHGFAKWLLLGEVISTSKAIVWPYFYFSIPSIIKHSVKYCPVSNDYQLINIERELIDAIENRNISKINEFIADSHFNVNMKVDGGKSLLMMASRRGAADIVEMLLDKGAKVNYRDPLGATALMYASTLIFANRKEANDIAKITEMLISRGANVNLKCIDGMTALMYASKLGHEKIVKNILSCKNVDIDIRDKLDGMTALMLASSFGNANIVKMLVKNGANITLKNNEGKTALMLASSQHYTEISNIIHQQSTND